MADTQFQDLLDALDDLLVSERRALLKGDLDKVARLSSQKEILIEQLVLAEGRDTAALKGLDDNLKRNQLLLDSALEGLRRVARRLSALRRVRTALDTYDAKGDRQTIDIKAGGNLEKRA